MPKANITYSKKVCMLGTFGVGKTSLVRRYVHNLFDDQYLSTIGVQIYEKQIPSISCEPELKLIIWDIANIETLTQANRNYFKGASAAIMVFDLTRKTTFNEKQTHLSAFIETNPKAKLIFVGNKSDLLENLDSATEELTEIAAKYNSIHLVTSAKTGENILEIFQELKEQLLGIA